MAKVVGYIKLQLEAGKPHLHHRLTSLGSAWSKHHGSCKEFNEKTQKMLGYYSGRNHCIQRPFIFFITKTRRLLFSLKRLVR